MCGVTCPNPCTRRQSPPPSPAKRMKQELELTYEGGRGPRPGGGGGEDVFGEWGGGGWDPTVCVPKMAQQDFPDCKFCFLERWPLWSGGSSYRCQPSNIPIHPLGGGGGVGVCKTMQKIGADTKRQMQFNSAQSPRTGVHCVLAVPGSPNRCALCAPGGGGGWHKASVSDCLPLVAPIGLSPLLILTLCGPERVLVVSTEPPDDLSCLTTPGVGCPGDGRGGGGDARLSRSAWRRPRGPERATRGCRSSASRVAGPQNTAATVHPKRRRKQAGRVCHPRGPRGGY